MNIRYAEERGRTRLDWLDGRHSFSFGHYIDPAWMGFRSLRVINDDRITPGAGFPPHSHSDMEIMTYMVEGALAHRDSLGNGEVIHTGEVQMMSAGAGITHSEFSDATKTTRLLQVWLYPNERGLAPTYQQKVFSDKAKREGFCLLASPKGEDGSLRIHQDARIYATIVGETARTYTLAGKRGLWVQVVRGSLDMNGQHLREGDGVAIEEAGDYSFIGSPEAELLLFDMK